MIIRYLIIYMCISLSLISTNFLVKQVFIYLFAISLICLNIKIKKKYVLFLYIVLNVLLLYLLLFGDSINGSKCWIKIFNLSFQPSEFMKVVLIYYLSIIVTSNKKYLLKSIVITFIPSVLTFLEPDTGNVIMYIIILLSVIFYKTRNVKKYFKYIFTFLVISVFILFILIKNGSGYRFDRITSLINNNGYQLNRALVNIGSAGLFGQDDIVSIPFYETDFIFAYMVSKYGFLKSFIFIIFNMSFDLYLILSISKYHGYKRCMMICLCVLKIFNEVIHMFMCVGLFPIMGLPLPFVSLGGSSLISYALLLSILDKKVGKG